MSAAIDWAALVSAATRAREHAYCPYSGYQVGAALLTAEGHVFSGCNVENASYGLCLCAERSAVARMIAEGERSIVAIAVVTQGPEPGAPCGACRQTLVEFASDAAIGLAVAGTPLPARVVSLAALLPEHFRGDLVEPKRKPQP